MKDNNPFSAPFHSSLRRNFFATIGWATLAGVGVWVAVICAIAYVFDANVEEGQVWLHYTGDESVNSPYDDTDYYDGFVITSILTSICLALILLGAIVTISCSVAIAGRTFKKKRSENGKPPA